MLIVGATVPVLQEANTKVRLGLPNFIGGNACDEPGQKQKAGKSFGGQQRGLTPEQL